MAMTKDDLIAHYVRIRDQIAARKAAFDAEDSKDKEILRKIELVLLQRMDADGEESCRTGAGTAFVQETYWANVTDWDSLIKFIDSEGAFHFLEKRVAKTAVREYLRDTNSVPPGVGYGTKREVMVRRPTKKASETSASEDVTT